ncbi:MAG: OmpA family protein [Chlorobi bacterium]|nr:OmpA family protein [Chlorobiota bacterium]
MMSKIIIPMMIFLSGIIFQSDSQTNRTFLFKDNFSDNSAEWTLGKFNQIKKNHLIIFCDSSYLANISFKEFKINEKKDFDIETQIKLISGSKNKGYGIIWGASSWRNSLIFEINSGGYYKIYAYKNSELINIKKQTQRKDLIKTGHEYNTLTVKKRNNNLNFYINGVKVFTAGTYAFSGYLAGIIAGQNTLVAANYFYFKGEKQTINLLKKQISKFSKENIGKNINSPYSEIAPVIAPDGKTLYIARAGHPLNIKPVEKYDIWYAVLKDNGEWSQLKHAPAPLNNSGDNVVISVSPDNNTLFLETLYNPDGTFKSDAGISVSYRKADGGWTVPEKINIKNYYNKNIYESFAFSPGKDVLMMSVERNDSYGDKDLYVSFLQPDGSYGEPVNAGPVLNSYLGEGTPFIAPDNRTLYFYSFTEPGYGSADIFVSKRLDDSWTKWSQPKNLGKKINSEGWDVYYTVAAKGDYAYLVSSENSFGKEDIFRIKLEEEEKPDPVVIIYGKVSDALTGKPVSAEVVYENTKNGKIEGTAICNSEGLYKIVLPYGEKYNIRAEKKGYFALSETMNLNKNKGYKEIRKNLLISPLIKEVPVILKNVHFYPAKAVLLPGSYEELNRLVKLMKTEPDMEIEITGHTESRPGYEKQLMILSQKRVEAVKKYMIIRGIDASRIKTKALGGTKPLADNNTEAGRKQNRRVEFRILKK